MQLVQHVVYLCLLLGGLIFCWKNISEYLEGRTSYIETSVPTSKADWPILVISLPPNFFKNPGIVAIYGKHFFITATVFGKDEAIKAPLIMDRFVDTWLGLQLHISEMIGEFQCYKISPKWNGSQEIDFQHFGVQLTLWPNLETDPLLAIDNETDILLTVTSEQNAYGVGLNRWFDGFSRPYQINNGTKLVMTEYRISKLGNILLF